MRTRVLMILAVASVAHADPPKYVRKPALVIDVKPSARVKPIQPAHAAPQEPVVTADDVLAIEERTDPLHKEQEAILIQLIGDTPDSDPDKPDYLFRLAEQYAKQHRFWHLKAVGLTLHR